MAPLGRLWLQLARATLAANAGGVLARTRGLPRTPALRQAMPWRSDSLLLLAVLLGPGIVCKGLRGFSAGSGFCVPDYYVVCIAICAAQSAKLFNWNQLEVALI